MNTSAPAASSVPSIPSLSPAIAHIPLSPCNAQARLDTLTRGKMGGLNAASYLDAHDSYSYFHALDDLVMTGADTEDLHHVESKNIALPGTGER
jgi:hypothetical protein